MSKEEKELLLKDLCGRLPYRVKVKHKAQDFPSTLLWVDADRLSAGRKADEIGIGNDWGSIEFIKPYLRPMSSMTSDEYKELCSIGLTKFIGDSKEIDWLNKKMFDYRGLIPMGLALVAPEGMYRKEEEK